MAEEEINPLDYIALPFDIELMNPNASVKCRKSDLWQKRYFLQFEVDIETFKIFDSCEGLPGAVLRGMLTMTENHKAKGIMQDGEVEIYKEDDRPKGGAKSKECAMYLQEGWFALFLMHKYPNDCAEAVGNARIGTKEQSDLVLKQVLSISSKVQLDHDEQAAEKWGRIKQEAHGWKHEYDKSHP